MKHIRKQFNRFSFRFSILGTQVDAGESFDTEREAAIYCDLTKHYLRNVFKLDIAAGLDPRDFTTEAYRRDVDLSDPSSVLKAIPPIVREFINVHRDELNVVREEAPERKAWHVLRGSPAFYSVPAVSEWVQACERAEMDVEAFASLNGKYFLALMDGLSCRAADMLKPLALALKMHEGAVNAKLVARVNTLTELQTNLKATAEYLKFLAASLAEEQKKIVDDMAKLEATRPALT
jgi:hypothetical protein